MALVGNNNIFLPFIHCADNEEFTSFFTQVTSQYQAQLWLSANLDVVAGNALFVRQFGGLSALNSFMPETEIEVLRSFMDAPTALVRDFWVMSGSELVKVKLSVQVIAQWLVLSFFEVDEQTSHSLVSDRITNDSLNVEELFTENIYRRDFLRLIIDTIPSFIDIRAADSQIMLANKSFSDYCGIPIKSIIGMKLDAIFPNSDFVKESEIRHRHTLENRKQGYFATYRLPNQQNTGHLFVKEYKQFIVYKDELAVLTIGNVINDLMEARHLYFETSARYKRIFDFSPVGIFVFNSQGIIENCNDKFCEIIGSPRSVLEGLNLFVGLKEKRLSQATQKSLISGHEVFEGWYDSQTSGKSVYGRAFFQGVQDNSGVYSSGIGIVEDLTDIIHARRNNADTQQLLDTVFETIDDAIFVIDADCKILIKNDKTKVSAEYDKKCFFRSFNMAVKCEICFMNSLIKTCTFYETEYHNPESEKYFNIRVMPSKLSLDTYIYVVQIKDISTYKSIERGLENAKLQAEESERLKSVFLANISHEIRTPMNSIMGFSELLQDDDIEIYTRKRYGKVIKENTLKLLNVVENIILLSKIESNQLQASPQKFQINDLFDEVVNEALYKAKQLGKKILTFKKVNLVPDLDSWIYTDYDLLRISLFHLMDNAIKFSERGTIQLIFETDFFKTFCIKVKDEGCGIAPENAEIVYLPFRKAPNETVNFSHGNGIGLTITKGIAHTLGAELSFESELEKGTCFSLLFKHKRIVPQS